MTLMFAMPAWSVPLILDEKADENIHHILKGEVKYARKYDEALSSSPKR